MICPRCHTEYRKGFDRCADCDIPLVDELPPEPEPPPTTPAEPDGEWVVIANLTMQTDVVLLKSMLDSEGIHFVVLGDSSVFIMDGPALAVRFMVPAIDVDRAREVVEQLAEGYQGPPQWND